MPSPEEWLNAINDMQKELDEADRELGIEPGSDLKMNLRNTDVIDDGDKFTYLMETDCPKSNFAIVFADQKKVVADCVISGLIQSVKMAEDVVDEIIDSIKKEVPYEE